MEKYVIVEYPNTFSVISDTFKSLHRIKILDFDVSNKYIVFGASSGGIYVFKRSPCSLIKFIPSTDGSTLHVKISSEENHLAIANSKGLIVILENFFVDLTVRPIVQTDHEGNIVTAINWHENELYSGDNTGKVSVFTLEKTFFQNPSAVLLNLDTSIVQIDNYQNYFIVSTKSRSYLCDGVKGQYKQIGEKIRNGENGACFCRTSLRESGMPFITSREIFKTAEDSKEFALPTNGKGTKIYCARSRGRLWEANFKTSVLKTYNFRNLPQDNTDILIIDDTQDTKLTINRCDSNAAEYLNFNKIYAIGNRFIVTYDINSIHIVDPVKSSLVFSKTNFKNILGFRVFGNFIFIWTTDFAMNIVSLQKLEDLIVNTLLNKQYFLCSEICLHFKNHLINCTEKSSRLSLLVILKNKLPGKKEFLKELDPLFSYLESCYENISSGKTFKSDVITVYNGHIDIQEDGFFSVNTSEEMKHSVNKEDKNGDAVNNNIFCLYRQYNLNKLQAHVQLTEYQNLIKDISIDQTLLLMEEFREFIQETENDIIEWIQMQLIKVSSMKLHEIKNLQPKTLTFLTNAFLKINSQNLYCRCLFPLPEAHKRKIEHYDLGVQLFSLLNNKKYYLNSIPYFYGLYLKETSNINDCICLRLLVQFSDLNLLKENGRKLTYDSWEEIVKFFIQLKERKCLNCSENIEINDIWSWTELGLVMIRSIGPKNSIRLLKRYSAYITNGELTSIFFKCCIMAKAYEEYPLIIDVVKQDCNHHVKFNTLMERYLERQYLYELSDNERTIEEFSELQTCSFCDLPLNGPILNQYKKCICGNFIHYLCFISNDKICNNCLT